MDRRDALKKLGMGGATAVGASMVVSSPAFANPGTPADIATAVSGQVSVLRTRSNTATQFTLLTNTISVTCPQSGPGSFVDSILWFNNATGATTSTFEPNGSGSFSRTISFRVRCLDRDGEPICATYTGSFSYSHSGNTTNVNASLFQLSIITNTDPCPQP